MEEEAVIKGGKKGTYAVLLRTKSKYLSLLRAMGPEMLIPSVLTATTCCPRSNSLAMMVAKRPKRWPLQSITTFFSNIFKVNPLGTVHVKED